MWCPRYLFNIWPVQHSGEKKKKILCSDFNLKSFLIRNNSTSPRIFCLFKISNENAKWLWKLDPFWNMFFLLGSIITKKFRFDFIHSPRIILKKTTKFWLTKKESSSQYTKWLRFFHHLDLTSVLLPKNVNFFR